MDANQLFPLPGTNSMKKFLGLKPVPNNLVKLAGVFTTDTN